MFNLNHALRFLIPVLLCTGVQSAHPEPAAARKMNVLFIAVDDMRPELGCYGNPLIKSPNIDQLAKNGLQFNHAYCQFALCNPSRSSLLSGRRPESIQVFDLKTFLRKNNPDIVTLPELFKNNGYTSLSFGKIFHTTNGNHEDKKSWSEPAWKNDVPKTPPQDAASSNSEERAADPDPDGSDHSNDMPYGAPDVADEELIDGKIARAAIAAMDSHATQPLFLGVGFHRPHMPFIAPKHYWDLYDPAQIKLAPNPFLPNDAPAFASNDASELRRYKGVAKTGPPVTDEEARTLIQGYYASISYVDTLVGKLLAELDRLKLRENTIIVLWGDHGYQLGEHATWNKRTDWEIATRVPLIISYPGQKTRGAKCDALVEFVDMYPTLAGMCGLPLPEKLEGTSFQPLLEKPDLRWKRAAFSIYHKAIPKLGGESDGRAMRTARYRFIEWKASDPQSTQTVRELYDDQVDPQENTNIANKPENQKLVQELTEQLHAGWKAAVPR